MNIDLGSSINGRKYAKITCVPPNCSIDHGFVEVVREPLNFLSRMIWGDFDKRIKKAKYNAKMFKRYYKVHKPINRESLVDSIYVDRIKYCKNLSKELEERALKYSIEKANEMLRENYWYRKVDNDEPKT